MENFQEKGKGSVVSDRFEQLPKFIIRIRHRDRTIFQSREFGERKKKVFPPRKAA